MKVIFILFGILSSCFAIAQTDVNCVSRASTSLFDGFEAYNPSTRQYISQGCWNALAFNEQGTTTSTRQIVDVFQYDEESASGVKVLLAYTSSNENGQIYLISPQLDLDNGNAFWFKLRMAASDPSGNGGSVSQSQQQSILDNSSFRIGTMSNNTDKNTFQAIGGVRNFVSGDFSGYRRVVISSGEIGNRTDEYMAIELNMNLARTGILLDEFFFDDAAALPIGLQYLNVERGDNANIVRWELDGSADYQHITIQSSIDGVYFEDRQTYTSSEIRSDNAKKFHFVDANTKAAQTYYRLKEMHRDGRISYSHIVVAQHGNTTVTLFPNPVSERLQLLHDLDHVEHLTLTISNQYGQIVQTATGVATLDVDNLPTGQYVLHVQHPTVQHQIIFVKTQ